LAIVIAICGAMFLMVAPDNNTSKQELSLCSKMCEVHKTDVRTFESGTCVCK